VDDDGGLLCSLWRRWTDLERRRSSLVMMIDVDRCLVLSRCYDEMKIASSSRSAVDIVSTKNRAGPAREPSFYA
jgi:hypothetical protein